jgi:hypothetical protein
MKMTNDIRTNPQPSGITFETLLPGPTRKRTRSRYSFRLSYRNPRPGTPGCALLWEVVGGREPYQVALERDKSGDLRWHCTCADAIYRGEDAPHLCKHVRGLQQLGKRGRSSQQARVGA